MPTQADNDFVPLNKAIRAHIRAEIRRTGMTAKMLLSDDGELPPGLTSSLVNRWIGGIVKTAPEAQVDFVIARFAATADAKAC